MLQLLAEAIDPPPEERVRTTVRTLAQTLTLTLALALALTLTLTLTLTLAQVRTLAGMGALEAAAGGTPGDAGVAMELTRLGVFASAMPLDVKLSKLVRAAPSPPGPPPVSRDGQNYWVRIAVTNAPAWVMAKVRGL